ncbi:kinase-like protein [Aspergillus terreus]|uniref:Kinase-like protein n=1 Tax=Aspergillus terreus TaxID=33178 RepID=A0A5M3YZ00_ASPTE|nr:hypothetical protein ATETN484_0005069700 [Aspergillus terreus]GFF17349.1 kinase-like protein [Aspergillus terreus]
MLASLLRSLPPLGRAWKPLDFSNPNFVRIPLSQKMEEETMPDYVASRYYPARIGEIFKDRYQIVGKLGFGASSTVWLARDMNYRRYVTLKIFIKSMSMGQQLDDELQMYKRLERGSKNHPGRSAVRSLLDSFDVNGPEDKHRCLVHPPLWDSVLTFLHRNPEQRLPAPVLAFVLKRLFLALDYLHTECQIIHTDIKADNIMFGIADDLVFSEFEENELQSPCPRKELDGRTIYVSRELRMPRNWGAPVLCDFGSAVPGGEEHTEDIQPNIYRAPEVILEVPWTYSVDIWNVGCMIWNIFEAESLFTGYDPESQTYRSRAHLAEIIKLLGPPPPSLLARGKLNHKFFSGEDDLRAKVPSEGRIPLERRETTLHGQDKANFLRLMQKMLQWEPANRSSARELQEDEWISPNESTSNEGTPNSSTPNSSKKRRRPELSEYDRGVICGMRLAGASLNEISRKLNTSRSTVQYTIKKQEAREAGKTQKRSGRPHIISPEAEDHIVRLLEADHAVTYKAIREAVNLTASDETIRRVFKKRGLAHLREQMNPEAQSRRVSSSMYQRLVRPEGTAETALGALDTPGGQ